MSTATSRDLRIRRSTVPVACPMKGDGQGRERATRATTELAATTAEPSTFTHDSPNIASKLGRQRAWSVHYEVGERPRDACGRLVAGPGKSQQPAGASVESRDTPAEAERMRTGGQRLGVVSQDRVHAGGAAFRPGCPGPESGRASGRERSWG